MDPLECCIVGALRGPHGIKGLDTDDGDEHPLFDERVLEPLDEAMIANIDALGVQETILVRKDGDVPQVVDGRRRVLHAREANRRRAERGQPPIAVPALNFRGSDLDTMSVAIATNEIRTDDSPLAKARKAQRLLRHGETETRAALMFGVEVPTLRSWLRLLDCDDTVLAAVEAGNLTSSAALPLAQLPRADQREELASAMAGGRKPTAKETTARAKARRRKAPPRQVPPGSIPTPDEPADIIIAPGKRAMKRVLQAHEDGADIADDVIKTIKWVLGITGPQTIRGLTAALRADA